jgi:flagellar biosynthesis/type III secretory pathway M-ring protein FliF/YscJ
VILQGPVPPTPPVPPPFDPNLVFANGGIDAGVVTIVVFALIAATIILWPVMRALARRLEGKSADPALRDEVERLQQRLEEMDALHGRMAELEERVDFTERILVRGQESPEPGRLPER